MIDYCTQHPMWKVATWRPTDHPRVQNDQSTLHDTEIELACPAGNAVTVLWGDGTSSALVCDGAVKTLTHTYTATGQYEIAVVGDVDQITNFYCRNQAWISGELADIVSGLESVVALYLYNTSICGDLSAVSGLTSLRILALYSTLVSGVLSAVSTLTTVLEILYLYNTSICGDLSAVSGLTSLADLRLGNTSISSYTSTPLPAWAGCNIWINDLGLSTSDLDDFIIDLADGVGTNGDLTYIAGNDARSSASDAAVTALSAAGWGGDIP